MAFSRWKNLEQPSCIHTYYYTILYYIFSHTHTVCLIMISIWICVYKIRIICNVCNMYIIFQYCCQQVELLHYEILLNTSSFKLGSKRGKKSRLFLRALSQGLRVGGEEQDTEGNRCQGVFLQFYMVFPWCLQTPTMPKGKVRWFMLRAWEPPCPKNGCKIPQILWLSSRTLGVSWVT